MEAEHGNVVGGYYWTAINDMLIGFVLMEIDFQMFESI